MPRAGTIGFMRFAHQAAGAAVFRAFTFMMHRFSPLSGAASRRPDFLEKSIFS